MRITKSADDPHPFTEDICGYFVLHRPCRGESSRRLEPKLQRSQKERFAVFKEFKSNVGPGGCSGTLIASPGQCV